MKMSFGFQHEHCLILFVRLAMKKGKLNVLVAQTAQSMASLLIRSAPAIRIFYVLPIGVKRFPSIRLAAKALAKVNEPLASIHWCSTIFQMGNSSLWPDAIKPCSYSPKMAFDSGCWAKCINRGFGQQPFIHLDHQWLELNL